MRDVSYFTKIFVATAPVDFRKQAHGLALIVDHALGLQSLADRSLFVFTNRSRQAVKMLYWERNGYAMWWKTLEKDKFRWPESTENGKLEVAPRELKWLLEGIDISRLQPHKTLRLS